MSEIDSGVDLLDRKALHIVLTSMHEGPYCYRSMLSNRNVSKELQVLSPRMPNL